MTRQWNFVLLGFCDALKSLAVMVPSEAALAAPMILPLVAVAGLPQRSFLLDIFLWLQVRSSTHGLEVNSQFRKKTTKILLKRVSLISSTTLRYKNHHIFACFLKSFNFYFFGPIICVSLLKILFFVVVFVHCLKHNYFFWCLIWDSGLKVETRVHYNNLFFMIYLLQFLKSLIQ